MIARFIPMFLKSKEQVRNNIIIANLIDIGLAGFIFYNHFYNN